MKILFWTIFTILALGTTPNFEQKLAGITIGDPVSNVAKVFGSRVRIENGLPVVEYEGGCRLQFAVDDIQNKSDRRKTSQRISVIVLQRTGPISGECRDLKTSRGISLLNSPQDVENVYGKSTIQKQDDDKRIVRYLLDEECRGHSYSYRELAFRWSSAVAGLQEIEVSRGEAFCKD